MRIGRADPAPRDEAPKRLRRLPIPTGCQNKSSLSVTTERSGAEAAAAAAAVLPGAAARLSAGRWRGAPAAVSRLRLPAGCARPGLGGRLARRRVPFVSRRPGVCITFRTPPSPFRLSFCFPLTLLPTPATIHPPANCGPPGLLYPSDASYPESCRRRRGRRRRAVKQSLAGPPPCA